MYLPSEEVGHCQVNERFDNQRVAMNLKTQKAQNQPSAVASGAQSVPALVLELNECRLVGASRLVSPSIMHEKLSKHDSRGLWLHAGGYKHFNLMI